MLISSNRDREHLNEMHIVWYFCILILPNVSSFIPSVRFQVRSNSWSSIDNRIRPTILNSLKSNSVNRRSLSATVLNKKDSRGRNETLRIKPLELEHELSDSFMRYALSIIMGRALPDIRDGLKPVHRRILYAMNELGLKPSGGYRKCARVVGEVLGKFHPHGDLSVYDALVRMSQDFVMSKTLVAGHGNFGSQDNDPPAAMRYTECKLSSLAFASLLSDLDLNTVDFIPNFDGNEMEPTILPAKFPMLLLNGASGIAVGMATNIPPHNLGELSDGLVALIKARLYPNRHVSDEELFKLIPAPDFPTGGIILGVEKSKQMYTTGKGSVLLRAKAKFETLNLKSSSSNATAKTFKKEAIVITQVPYLCNKASLLERIAQLVNEKKLNGISDLRDESDRTGVRIVIELKKDALREVVLNNLYLKTGLQTSFSGNFLALMKGGTSPLRFTLREALDEFLDFRLTVVQRRAKHKLESDSLRAHVVDGLLIAIKRIDAVIKVIRKEPNRTAAKAALMSLKPKALSNNQSEAVLGLQLGRLTNLDQNNLLKEKEKLESQISYLKTVVAEDKKVAWKEILDEVSELKKKFGTPRKTEISLQDGELTEEDVTLSYCPF